MDVEVLRRDHEPWPAQDLASPKRPTTVMVGEGSASEPPGKGFDW